MKQLNKNIKIMKNLIGIFILFVASGCATSGSNLSYYIPELDDGEVAKGKIFVIRSTGGKGSMYPIDIELNQNLLGSIKNSQIVIGDVSKGENKLYITYSVFGGVECNEDKKIFFSEENESHFFVIQMASQPDFWSINNECMKIYKTDESAFRVARGNPYTAGDEFKEFLKDIPSDLIDDVIRGDF